MTLDDVGEPARVSRLRALPPSAPRPDPPEEPSLPALADLLWARILKCEAPEEMASLARALSDVLAKLGDPVHRQFVGYTAPIAKPLHRHSHRGRKES